jgi:hypothetical protein
MKLAKCFPKKLAFWSAQLIAIAWPQMMLAQNQITTFDPPGAGTTASQGTFPQQDLNSGAIVGYFVDGNSVAHGFKRLGVERIREIARENGKKGGRPPKKQRGPSAKKRGAWCLPCWEPWRS